MRVRNPVADQPEPRNPDQSTPLQLVIEDPSFRNSKNSLLIQCADVCAYLLYQMVSPSRYMKQKSGQHYFARLAPILCHKATPLEPLGIVRL